MTNLQLRIANYEKERNKTLDMIADGLAESILSPDDSSSIITSENMFLRDWIEFECLLYVSLCDPNYHKEERDELFNRLWDRIKHVMVGPGAGLAVDRYVLMKAWMGNSPLYDDEISKGLPWFSRKMKKPGLIISISLNMAKKLQEQNYNSLVRFIINNIILEMQECSGYSKEDMAYLMSLRSQLM